MLRPLGILTLGCFLAALAAAQSPAAPTRKFSSPAEQAAIQQLVELNNNSGTGPNQLDAAIAQFQIQFPKSAYILSVLVMGERFHRARSEYLPMLHDGMAALAIAPDDLYTLATLGSAIPDNVKQTDLDIDQRLAQAEGYDRQVIAQCSAWIITPTGFQFHGQQLNQSQALAMRDNLEGPAFVALGRIANLRSDYAAAVDNFTRALAFEPSPEVQAETWLDIGQAQVAQNHRPEAIAAFQKTLTLAPNEPILDGMAQAALAKLKP